jgi:hypothetical protein
VDKIGKQVRKDKRGAIAASGRRGERHLGKAIAMQQFLRGVGFAKALATG